LLARAIHLYLLAGKETLSMPSNPFITTANYLPIPMLGLYDKYALWSEQNVIYIAP
jgi:hypothetical protein